MDSVQFALASDNFDVALHQPQPPGYFLYVMIGRIAKWFIVDTNAALVAVSITFSVLTVIAVYHLGREAFDGHTGLAAAVLAITSPLFWFHGEVALSYMPEAFMSALSAYLCLRVLKGDVRLFYLAAAVLGIAGGIRQNTMVFLMPLWLYSMKGIGWRRAALSLLVFGATVLAWFIPMVITTGGYERYSDALSAHWLDSNWRGIHLYWILFNARHMAYFLICGLAMALAPLIYGLYIVIAKAERPVNRDMLFFFSIWMAPAFLFHLVIFTHPAVPGHSLIYQVGLLVLSAKALTTTTAYAAGVPPRFKVEKARAGLLILIAAMNTIFFVFEPYPFSARSIKEHDRTLAAYIKAVRDNFSPADTEVIGTDRFILSYRHAMYYLPEYRVYDTVLLTTPEGPRLFWGQGGNTYRARYIRPLPSTMNFVDFLNYGPGDEAKLPPGAMVLPVSGGDFLVHYNKLEDLYGAKRIAPLIDPSLKVKG